MSLNFPPITVCQLMPMAMHGSSLIAQQKADLKKKINFVYGEFITKRPIGQKMLYLYLGIKKL